MNLDNLPHTTPDQALQDLYRDMIAAYIVAVPAAYRPALQAMQQRIDAAATLDESHVHAFDVLSQLFHGLQPGTDQSPADAAA